MHYYQFDIAEYRAETGHLSITEHGIYRQLIDWYYRDEKPIPLETQVVMRRLSLGSDMLHLLENVLSDFFTKTDKGYYKTRIENVIQNYQAQCAKNRVNGKSGGRPRKTQVVILENPKKPKRNPNKELRINNNKYNALAALLSLGVSEQVSNDWLKHRKTKKAEVTDTVIKTHASEALKAGISLEEALVTCCSRGWTGFKAEWIQGDLIAGNKGATLSMNDTDLVSMAVNLGISATGLSKQGLVNKINKQLGIK